jgi:hypothetical protein
MDLTYFVISVGSIALAGHMAHARNRSSRTWLWTAVLIGPLAPLVLVCLGKLDGAGPDTEGTDKSPPDASKFISRFSNRLRQAFGRPDQTRLKMNLIGT